MEANYARSPDFLMEDKTNEYYNENADNYSDINNELDMSLIYERFLPHVKAGGHILDGGCGPGGIQSIFWIRASKLLPSIDLLRW